MKHATGNWRRISGLWMLTTGQPILDRVIGMMFFVPGLVKDAYWELHWLIKRRLGISGVDGSFVNFAGTWFEVSDSEYESLEASRGDPLAIRSLYLQKVRASSPEDP